MEPTFIDFSRMTCIEILALFHKVHNDICIVQEWHALSLNDPASFYDFLIASDIPDIVHKIHMFCCVSLNPICM